MLTNSRVIALPEDAQFLSNWSIGYFSLDTFIMIFALVIAHKLHIATRLGRYINAVGDNEEVAKKVGINTRKTVFITYILSGVFAGFSSLCSFIQVGSISGFLGKGLEFNAIAVAVVGGLSLAGGRGKILPGVFTGAIAFQIISNGLNQISANPYIYQLVTGGVIFIAMLMDSNNSSGLIARFTVKKLA
ncbi:ABC transporter permease [Klebsiella michiganensis]|uniref:ABC transporter permease n=1 Tax=Klebsiella michiganensis TaxID=1134687 RepID=UPI0021CAD66D|nr:ABC transporter permease [Klebsiella michiganensis]UXO81804.1 ABC transporter permease [Klebsiella michiganensis]